MARPTMIQSSEKNRLNGLNNGNGEHEQKEVKVGKESVLVITPPKLGVTAIQIVGVTPLVQNRFSEKAKETMIKTQQEGNKARKKRNSDPKDFEACFQAARWIADYNNDLKRTPGGWDGIHAVGFRHGLIDVCSVCNFHMTKAKKTLFIVADGYAKDGTPLVKITKGTPKMVIHPVRNTNGGTDQRPRPMWSPGWECVVRVQFDQDWFSLEDVVNLMNRVGLQNGIGEGRPNSTKSVGCDWGRFEVKHATHVQNVKGFHDLA